MNNIFVSISSPQHEILYFSAEVQEAILDLPDGLAARYVFLTRRMVVLGPNLGEPHTKSLGQGLFGLRLKSREGIARVLFCAVVALSRLKQVKHEIS